MKIIEIKERKKVLQNEVLVEVENVVSFELDIEEDLRVKDLRKIQPIISDRKDGDEIEMIISFIKAFSTEDKQLVEDRIDNLTVEGFTQLGEQVSKLLSKKDSKKK